VSRYQDGPRALDLVLTKDGCTCKSRNSSSGLSAVNPLDSLRWLGRVRMIQSSKLVVAPFRPVCGRIAGPSLSSVLVMIWRQTAVFLRKLTVFVPNHRQNELFSVRGITHEFLILSWSQLLCKVTNADRPESAGSMEGNERRYGKLEDDSIVRNRFGRAAA